jgi:hypothetical protein
VSKNIQIKLPENSGTVLPGYTPSVGFLGSSRPGLIFGSQDMFVLKLQKMVG